MSYKTEMLEVLMKLKHTGQVMMDLDRDAEHSSPLLVAMTFFSQLALLHGYELHVLHEILDELAIDLNVDAFVQEPPSQVQ